MTVHHAGKTKIEITLTGKGRLLLKGARNLRLTAGASFTSIHTPTIRSTKTITLHRYGAAT